MRGQGEGQGFGVLGVHAFLTLGKVQDLDEDTGCEAAGEQKQSWKGQVSGLRSSA